LADESGQSAGAAARSPAETSALPGQVPGSSISLWRNRDFAAFWVGETVSQLGSQVTFIALPLVGVLTLHVTTGQLGILRFAELSPFLACTLFLGVWADRSRRRPLMIASNAVRGVLIGSVPLLAALGLLSLPVLICVAIVTGLCAALFDVCWLSYVPGLVDRGRLIEAMGKVSMSHASAEVAGPGVGGLLVQLATAPFALVLDAVSYLVSVTSLLTIRHHEPPPARGPGARRHFGGELTEGLRFAFREPHIRATALVASMSNFFGVLTETVFLLYAVRVLHFRPGLIGLILSAIGAGGLLGAACANMINRRFPLGRVYVGARLAGGLGAVLLPLAAGPDAVVVAMSMASFFIVQAAVANTNVLNTSLRQVLTPDEIRGRMNASVRTLAQGSPALGGLAAGLSGSLIGLHATLWLGSIGYAAAVIPVLASPIPRLRSLPQRPIPVADTLPDNGLKPD
jgi:MFS family permease